MGCGFSEHKASDEERILKSNETNGTMGGAIGKDNKKSSSSPTKQSKAGKDSISTASEANKFTKKINNSNKQLNNGRKITEAPPAAAAAAATVNSSSTAATSALAFNVQNSSEVSSSQVNFFKMLDEKIENGIDPEEPDMEHERQLRLQRVAEEWDNLLGRSQDSNDLHSKEQTAASSAESQINEEETTDNSASAAPEKLAMESSNDSMRTMFSNSVTLPAGSLREAVAAIKTGSTSRPPSALGTRQKREQETG